MIAKVGPRWTDVASLIRYVYGTGRTDDDPGPHIVAGYLTPAELEPPRRPNGRRDFRRLAGLVAQLRPVSARRVTRHRSGTRTARAEKPPRPTVRVGGAQVAKVKDRFGIGRVVLVGDRGMLTAARLREDVAPAQLDWITALRASQVKKLVRGGDLQLTVFDTQDLAEITSPDFPGERLVACMNPFLEAERARKRESLLKATEADLKKIAAACARARAPLRGKYNIAVRVDRVLSQCKVAKHFQIDIGDDRFSYARNQDSITAEAALNGIYVLRTSVRAGDLDSPDAVSSYKALAQIERAFRAFNTDLDIRPVRHRTRTRSERTCSCG